MDNIVKQPVQLLQKPVQLLQRTTNWVRMNVFLTAAISVALFSVTLSVHFHLNVPLTFIVGGTTNQVPNSPSGPTTVPSPTAPTAPTAPSHPQPNLISPTQPQPQPQQRTALVVHGWKLALQIPMAYCHEQKNLYRCRSIIPPDCTIHGMYALDPNGNSFPINPNWKSFYLAHSEIPRRLRLNLKTHWPQLKARRPDFAFWRYQYSKHGIQSGLNARDYFEQALMLKREVVVATFGGITSLFRQAQMQPGLMYDPNDICRYLVLVTHHQIPEMDIKCSTNFLLNKNQILEFQICFNTTHSMVPCSSGCRFFGCSTSSLLNWM